MNVRYATPARVIYDADRKAMCEGAEALVESIGPGDRVEILIPAGRGRFGQEWKPKTGRAVMRGPAGWVLNMGGAYGTPGIASPDNTLSVKKARR